MELERPYSAARDVQSASRQCIELAPGTARPGGRRPSICSNGRRLNRSLMVRPRRWVSDVLLASVPGNVSRSRTGRRCACGATVSFFRHPLRRTSCQPWLAGAVRSSSAWMGFTCFHTFTGVVASGLRGEKCVERLVPSGTTSTERSLLASTRWPAGWSCGEALMALSASARQGGLVAAACACMGFKSSASL